MRNAVKVSMLLSFHLLCFSMIELKDTGLFGSMSFVIVYAIFNLFFALGILLHGFFRGWFAWLFSKRVLLLPACLVYWFSGVTSLISIDAAAYLLSVCFSALLSGIIGGSAYYAIYACIPKWQRGRTIGAGLILGTLIHYFVEIFRIQSGTYFIFIFTAVFFIAVAGIYFLLSESAHIDPTDENRNVEHTVVFDNFKTLFLLLIVSAVFICYLSSLYEGILAMISPGKLSSYELFLLRNTKLLYCVSVAAAGLIADLKGRQYISVIAIAVMTFLIFNIFLLNFPAIQFLNWIVLFAGAGFLSMFITLNFIDIAGQTKKPALWAGGGRMIKHSVTAFGSMGGAAFWSHMESGYIIVILQYLIILIGLIFLLFQHYRIVTENVHPIVSSEIPCNEECAARVPASSGSIKMAADCFMPDSSEFGLTEREKQILGFIFAGVQTKDIAKELYITERTVKFHITNILNKTGAKNQKELISSRLNYLLNNS